MFIVGIIFFTGAGIAKVTLFVLTSVAPVSTSPFPTVIASTDLFILLDSISLSVLFFLIILNVLLTLTVGTTSSNLDTLLAFGEPILVLLRIFEGRPYQYKQILVYKIKI